jgi:hypothetical protein
MFDLFIALIIRILARFFYDIVKQIINKKSTKYNNKNIVICYNRLVVIRRVSSPPFFR